jgi:hypothetical protein
MRVIPIWSVSIRGVAVLTLLAIGFVSFAAEPCPAFGTNQRIHGTITVTGVGTSLQGGLQVNVNQSVKISVDLPALQDGATQNSYFGTFTTSAAVNDSTIDTKENKILETWIGNGSASPTIGDDYWNQYGGAAFAYWKASDATCGYALFVPKAVNGVAHMVNGTTSFQPFVWGISQPFDDPLLASATFHSEQQSAGTFSGSAVYKGYAYNEGLVEWKVNWDLSISGQEEVELMISSDEYDRWRPEAYIPPPEALPVGVASRKTAEIRRVTYDCSTKARAALDPSVDQPGNSLTFVATLQKTGGGVPSARRIRSLAYELINVSHEPGKAMNYPVLDNPSSDQDPDYRILAASNPSLNIVDSSHALTVGQLNSLTGQVVISSFDFGGTCFLHVLGTLDDGSPVEGHWVLDSSLLNIPIPNRSPGSRIAESWKQDHGVAGLADDDDSEPNPRTGTWTGDGLTLYEEYRGFIACGVHVEGDPKRQDLFIRNTIGGIAEPGITAFIALSGLRVTRLGSSELRFTPTGVDAILGGSSLVVADTFCVDDERERVVNANHSTKSAHVDQHAVVLTSRDKPGGENIPAPRPTGIGPPKNVCRIEIGPPEISKRPGTTKVKNDSDLYRLEVAHELMHSVGVPHHSLPMKDFLLDAYLAMPGNLRCPTDRPRVCVGGDGSHPINLLDEKTSLDVAPMLASHVDAASAIEPNLFPLPVTPLYVGAQGGWHSGDDGCIMRYYFAKESQPPKDAAVAPDTYYYLTGDEPLGTTLCTSSLGTGINGHDRQPRSRYGDADIGNCASWIIVNDKYSGHSL